MLITGIHIYSFELVSHRQKQQQVHCSLSKNNYEIEYGNAANNSERKNDNVNNDSNSQNSATKRRRRRGGKKSKRYREHRRQQVANLKPGNNKKGTTSIIAMGNKADNNATSTPQQNLDVVTYASIVKRQTI